MGQLSRPLLVALLAVVAFFGVWLVALRPSSLSSATQSPAGAPSSAQKAPGVDGLASAIKKAHQAAANPTAASGTNGGSTAAAPKPPTAPAAPSTAGRPGARSSIPGAATPGTPGRPQRSPATSRIAPAVHRVDLVGAALRANKVLALLFYNPAAADDRAVERELAAIPARGGRVAKLAIPLTELARYPVITSQVPVAQSPTLVLIDPDHQATTIVGFSDGFEIAQRISDALSVR